MTWDCHRCNVDGMNWEQYAEHAFLEHGEIIVPPDSEQVEP